MTDITRELKGWDQVNWLVHHFNSDVEHALDTMVEHNQDMTFLVEYTHRKGLKTFSPVKSGPLL